MGCTKCAALRASWAWRVDNLPPKGQVMPFFSPGENPCPIWQVVFSEVSAPREGLAARTQRRTPHQSERFPRGFPTGESLPQMGLV